MGDPKALALALVLDAAIGDPYWLWARMPHPVTLFGRAIGWLERRMNRAADGPRIRRIAGIALLALLLVPLSLLGAWVSNPVVDVIAVTVLVAQRSLYDHVKAVADADGLAAARIAVGHIVGRDPATLDQAGVCRAAIESCAESLSDGVVAPVFWYALAGLPGILAYKLVNTADSMVGHKDERYLDFGWAAARLDDLMNLIPARAAGLMIALVSRRPGEVVAVMRRDAPRHDSPNAGWPEAAMAASLGVALGGPRVYDGERHEGPWFNGAGRQDATPADIRASLRLLVGACLVQFAAVALVALF
jgi:adenosylcobinamide-phosphate synthase